MKITITQKIGAGFTILALLMILMSFSSQNGLTKLNQQMIIASEEIAPMLVSSGSMGVSLLAVNKTLMQFLATSDTSLMSEYETAFHLQQTDYTNSHASLQTLMANYPDISTILSDTDSMAKGFIQDAQEVITIRKDYINDLPSYNKSTQALKKQIKSFQQELEDIVNYDDDHKAINAATTLLRQLEIINTGADELGKVKTLQTMTKPAGMVKKAVEGMAQRIQQLSKDNASAASDMTKSLQPIQQHLLGKNGLLTILERQLNRTQQSNVLMKKMTLAINAATTNIKQVMSNVEERAHQAQYQAEETASSSEQTNLIIGLLSILLSAVVATSVCKSIRKPLKQMMHMLKVMSEGDMSQRITIVSKDEFADLSNWVNQLAEHLSGTITEIYDGCGQVTKMTRNTASLSENTRHRMDKQNEQTTIISQSMSKMVHSVKEVVEQTEQAQQAITDINTRADHNRETMDENTQMIQNLSEQINNATEVIHRLNDRSDSISHILDVIRDIAEQTNLLALNAAIEAARAGDQGRGFAVVADEVRTLASRTQQSTEKIHGIIQQLQNGASEAAEIMSQSTDSVQCSVDGIEKSDQALQKMVVKLEAIRDMSECIYQLTDKQNNTCNEVSESMKKISMMSDDCSSDTTDIVNESEQMVKLAQRQQKLVGQFTLSK